MFIIALIFFVLAAAACLATIAYDHDGGPPLLAGTCLMAGLIFTVLASASIVPTRNVGIVTAWGKPTGRTTGAGLKWHAPYQSIDDWDSSGQTYAHLGDQCVWVTIAAQRRACVPVQIEWSALPGNAPDNWAAYREIGDWTRFETWVNRRVNPQINAAMTSLFASFDPLDAASAKTGKAAAPDLNRDYREPLADALAQTLGGDIAVKSIAFEAPRYDAPTTEAIAQFGKKILDGRNLAVDEANADTRNRIFGKQSQADPRTRCLSIADEHGKEPGLCMGAGVALTRQVG